MVESFGSFLRVKIKEFLSRKGESLRWLAKQTKVEYHKLYRVESNELRSLSFFDARRLLKFIDSDGCMQVLADFYPDEVRDLTEFNEQDQVLDAIELAVKSPFHYQLYLVAAETSGANRQSVEKNFGAYGLQLLDLFLEKGVLTLEDNGSFKGVLSGIAAQPDHILREVGKIHIDSIQIGDPGSFGGADAKGLNLVGQQRAYKIVTSAWHEMAKIYRDPTCRGDELSAFALFFGSVNWEQS